MLCFLFYFCLIMVIMWETISEMRANKCRTKKMHGKSKLFKLIRSLTNFEITDLKDPLFETNAEMSSRCFYFLYTEYSTGFCADISFVYQQKEGNDRLFAFATNIEIERRIFGEIMLLMEIHRKQDRLSLISGPGNITSSNPLWSNWKFKQN